jgi:hypothetical protein
MGAIQTEEKNHGIEEIGQEAGEGQGPEAHQTTLIAR